MSHDRRDNLPAWIKLRGRLSVPEAAERMGISRRTGDRYENRWREQTAFFATEREPQTGGVSGGSWVAYPAKDTILELKDPSSRAALAWGRGATKKAALEDAHHRGHRILDDSVPPARFPDAAVPARGMDAPWDFGGC